MGQVSVLVNGRNFTITCDDGQEARTRRLAQYVDTKVGQFAASVGQVGEAKLLLLAALAIADELADANEAREQERNRAGPAPEAREQERNRAGPAPEAREQKRNRASPEPEAVHGASKPDEAIAARLIAS
jgi:cell division protein ZapA